ncbi:MAG: hypothetical protein IAE86_08490 [Burkholderiaceae bacterium]|nr:hypothetical protein [Burkholderiaceae bacterium]
MTEPEAPKPIADAIEFEITDFAAAREALDEPPSGVGRAATFAPGYWERMRRKLLPRDRALAGPTIDWLLTLAPTLRPRLLCEHYPRIANQIAELWPHPEGRARFLDALLTDARGGRRGFAPEVRREIETLRRL